MPDLTSRLIVELVDRVSANAGKTGKAIHGISDEMTKLQGVSRKFADTRDMFKGFTGAQAGFAKAKENINRITRELRDAKKAIEQMNGVKLVKGDILFAPLKAGRDKVKELERELKSAQREVSSTSRVFVEQGKAIKGALSDLGIKGIKNFITAEQQLKASVDAANQSFREQKKFSESGWTIRHNSPIGPPAPAAKPSWRDRFARPAGLPGPNIGGLYGMAASAIGGVSVFDAAKQSFEFEVAKNKLEGRSGWSRSDVMNYSDEARRFAMRTGKAGPGGIAGLLGMAEEYGKSGLNKNAAQGLMEPTLNFSAYGEIDPSDAAKNIVRSSQIFGLPLDTRDNSRKSATRISDAMSYAANKSSADVRDVFSMYSIAGNYAAMAGLSPEQVAAMSATMVQGGISGDRAGTALRSGLVRMVKPTNDSMAALSELGLDLNDFAVSKRDWSASTLMDSMATRFGQPKTKGAQARLQSLIDSKPENVNQSLSDFFIKETGSKGAQDQAAVSKAVGKFMASQINQIDWPSVVDALAEKGINGAYASRIFDARQGGNLMTLINDKGQAKYNEIMAGFNNGEGAGSSKRGSDIMVQGIVGDWGKFTASLQDLVLSISDSGALTNAASAIRDITSAIQSLNKVGNEKVLAGYDLNQLLNGKASGDAGRAVGDFIGTSKIGPAIKRWWSGSNEGKPMGAAMGSFHPDASPVAKTSPYAGNLKVIGDQSGVKVETVEANGKIAEVKTNLNELSATTATPMVALNGAEATLGVLKSILDYIKQINATQISPPGMRGVHADVGSGSSSGW